MSEEKYKDIIAEMESLPQGGITYKKISGKEYAYYQWREEGKQRSRRAKDDELESLMAQIERRKELEGILREAGILSKAKNTKPRKKTESMPAEKTVKTPAKAKTKAKQNAKTAAKVAPVTDQKIETRWLTDEGQKAVRTALYQPDEICQAEELIAFLMEDEFFGRLSTSERAAVAEALTRRIQARLLEDRLHLETKAAKPGCEVFHLHIEDGAFDMVVADPKAESCELYEIKDCTELTRAHCTHLLDDTACDAVAKRYGQIAGKFVIYNGKTINVMESGSAGKLESVKYWNAEKYVESLKK